MVAFWGRLARQLALWGAVWLVASFCLFAAVRLIPGDGLAGSLKHPDPAVVARWRTQLGLDQPLPVQYGAYLRDFATGQWGMSLGRRQPVLHEVALHLPATLELSVCALLLGTVLGLGLATAAQVFRQPWLGLLARGTGALGLTVPIFWIGLLLLLLAVLLPLGLPAGGRWDFAQTPPPTRTGFLLLDALLSGQWEAVGVALSHLVLPTFTLSLYPAALVCGVYEARLRDPRLQTLVRALRAKGLGPGAIWGKHVLRLLGAPLVVLLGTHFGGLLGGAVLTETVFSWPGMGRYLVEAVLQREIFIIQHAILLLVLLAFGAVLLSDIVAYAMNPQARLAAAAPSGC